ncbi:MAG: hypothetical protein AB1778_02345 [Candidatus Bipolaricaulota bacterium]
MRTVARFLAAFLLFLIPASLAWVPLAPAYHAAVAGAVRPALRWVERDDVSVVSAQGEDLGVYRKIGGDRVAPFMTFDRYAFFALVPLLALLAATPGVRAAGRIWRMIAAGAALYLVHVLYVVASVGLAYAALGLSGDAPHAALQTAVRWCWEAAPIVLWLVLTAGAWRRVLFGRAADSEGSMPVRPRGCEG